MLLGLKINSNPGEQGNDQRVPERGWDEAPEPVALLVEQTLAFLEPFQNRLELAGGAVVDHWRGLGFFQDDAVFTGEGKNMLPPRFGPAVDFLQAREFFGALF